MIKWENTVGITTVEKRKKNENKKVISERKKRKMTGKRNNFYHIVDENFYDKVKRNIGFWFPFRKKSRQEGEGEIWQNGSASFI